MFILRLLSGMFALLIAFVTSLMTKIDFIYITTLFSFVMIVDHMVCHMLERMYMQAVMGSITDEKKDKDKDGSNTSR